MCRGRTGRGLSWHRDLHTSDALHARACTSLVYICSVARTSLWHRHTLLPEVGPAHPPAHPQVYALHTLPLGVYTSTVGCTTDPRRIGLHDASLPMSRVFRATRRPTVFCSVVRRGGHTTTSPNCTTTRYAVNPQGVPLGLVPNARHRILDQALSLC
jgi:hypothetical protein